MPDWPSDADLPRATPIAAQPLIVEELEATVPAVAPADHPPLELTVVSIPSSEPPTAGATDLVDELVADVEDLALVDVDEDGPGDADPAPPAMQGAAKAAGRRGGQASASRFMKHRHVS